MKILSLILILLTSNQLQAAKCPTLLQKIEQFLELHKLIPLKEKIGLKGFLGETSLLTDNSSEEAKALGILPWSLRIFPVKSIKEARMHNEANPYKVHKHIYFISENGIEDFSDSNIQNIFKTKIANTNILLEDKNVPNLIWIDASTNEVRHSSKNIIDKFLTNGPVRLLKDHLIIEGHTLPDLRGIIKYKNVLKRSNEIKMLNLHLRNNFEIKFNGDIEKVIDALKSQEYKIDKGIHLNRFKDLNGEESQSVQSIREKFRKNLSITTEIYGPYGNILAGNNNFINTTSIKGDSIYSNLDIIEASKKRFLAETGRKKLADKLFQHKNIILSAELAFADYLHSKGINFYDSLMVTNFTKKVGATVISLEEFLGLIEDSKPLSKIDFPSQEWKPSNTIQLKLNKNEIIEQINDKSFNKLKSEEKRVRIRKDKRIEELNAVVTTCVYKTPSV